MKIKLLACIAVLLCLTGCAEIELNDRTKLLALYSGISLNRNDRNIDIFSQPQNEIALEILDRYNRDYFAYSNGEFVGKYHGTVVERGLDYFWEVETSDVAQNAEVFLSEQYDPYPRKTEYLDSPDWVSDVISMTNRRFKVDVEVVETVRIDLDADYRSEYLFSLKDAGTNSQYLYLCDDNGNLISYLFAATNEDVPFEYDLGSNIEIIDFDNDGVMEIIVSLLSYEGFIFRCYKYENGIFYGDELNECTMKW